MHQTGWRILCGLMALTVVASAGHARAAGRQAVAVLDFAGAEVREVDSWWQPAGSQRDYAEENDLPLAFENGQGQKLVLIPAGTFSMGSPPGESGRDEDEGPVHAVELARGFYMGAMEVTNGEYRWYRSGHDSMAYKGLSLNGEPQPVVSVSWDNARAYCGWLTEQERRAGKLAVGWAYRLPTEAEWEYACRAGSRGRYWWGESESAAGRYANVADRTAKARWANWAIFDTNDGHAVTAPVGRYEANGFGLYDTTGNVWEWCADWYGKTYHGQAPRRDPAGSSSRSSRVLRGGSWHNRPRHCRSADRYSYTPGNTRNDIGFRVVLSPAPRA